MRRPFSDNPTRCPIRGIALVVEIHIATDQLSIAASRNLGAGRAIEQGADILIFLDLDCVPTDTLLSAYADAARLFPNAILSGAVGYLPEGTDAFSPARAEKAYFHEFHPRLRPRQTKPAHPTLFWSLSFAMTTWMWQRAGGFCEDYLGYGAEETDFAQISSHSGIPWRHRSAYGHARQRAG
jgi:GT2 family glycosyltransferase